MNTKAFRSLMIVSFLLGLVIFAGAQAPTTAPKAVKFVTAPKLTISKLKSGESDVYDVRGKMSCVVKAANSDDTVNTDCTYTLPDDARQQIAKITGKQLSAVPTSLTRKDMVLTFQKGTGGAVINLEISPMDLDAVGATLHFNRSVIDVQGRDGGAIAQYTNEEMEALFTAWAKQINAGRARRGIIARMNRCIAGEPEQ